MDIYSYLRKDHKKVSSLFEKIITSTSLSVRKKLSAEILQELYLHADTEEKTFYKALDHRSKKSYEEAEHGKKEHKEIKDAMKKLALTDPKKNQWFVQLGALKHIVEHHVKEEESEMFKVGKKVISKKEANDLAIEMDEMKLKLMKKKK